MVFFSGGEVAENEVDIADLGTQGVVGAEAEAGESVGAEVGGDGFETVVAATTAFFAEAELTKVEVKIVAEDEDVFGRDFVEVSEGLDGFAGVVVEILGFDEEIFAVFEPERAHFGLLPGEIFDFGIKIEGEEAEIVASEVVFWAGIAEADDEIHKDIIT